MDKKKDKQKDNDDTLITLQETFNTEVPVELEKSLRKMLKGFRQDLKEHPYFGKKGGSWRFIWRWLFPFYLPVVRFIFLTGTGAACVAIAIMLIFGNKSTTWADVEEQFREIPYCSVSVYYGNKYVHGPGKIQYWISSDGRVRIHKGDKIGFMNLYGYKRYLRTYSLATRQETPTTFFWKNILRSFESVKIYGKPTLKSIIEAMSGENMIDTTSLLVSDAEVSKDLLVFDAESYDTLWNIRVWALRESKLPIRIIKWHRKYARYEDVLFNYSIEQPKEFFDPEAFAEKLKDPSFSEYELRYMFLRDPGRRPFASPGS
ncbi:hypothetical protein ACFL2O_07140 [Thermodesulfobacteriota bacterium]